MVTGYGLFAALFIDHGEALTGSLSGQGSDPSGFIWFLDWWPWAISHHLDPLFTTLVWQPSGVALGWLTSVPLLAVAGWPLTLISPVLTFNFFVLLGPVLAAFMAYLLCLDLARRADAAIIGGFLFGFSSYEMAQDTATLNLSFTMFLPALLLIVLRRLDGRLSRINTILLAGLTLICQFLVCIEVFGMMVVFGALAWALAAIYLPERRAALRRLAADALLTAPIVLAVLSPLLRSMARHAATVNLPALWPDYYATDLLNFIVPGQMNLLGGRLAGCMSHRFPGGVQEQDGYLGLPLLAIILFFAREQAGDPRRRLLLAMFLLLAVFSLGPRLWIAGHCLGAVLPWMLFVHLPLLSGALPVRFGLFVSLAAAMMAAIWIAVPAAGDARIRRVLLGAAACLFLTPAWHPWMPIPAARFFQPGRVQAVLGADARVLILPFSIQGPSSFWQAENHYGFVQTGGYLGFPPRPMQIYPAVSELFGGTENPGFLNDVVTFCAATHTQFIVIGPGTSRRVQEAITRLNWPRRIVDDVVIYAVPAGAKISNG